MDLGPLSLICRRPPQDLPSDLPQGITSTLRVENADLIAQNAKFLIQATPQIHSGLQFLGERGSLRAFGWGAEGAGGEHHSGGASLGWGGRGGVEWALLH